jgi:hypothetical protein
MVEKSLTEATELLDFWKNAVLRIRVLEREAGNEVDLFKSDTSNAQSEGSTLDKERWAREMIEKLSIRNGLRRSLKEAISTMQLTRQLVELGLSLRNSMKSELSLNDKASEFSLNSDSAAEYIRNLENFKISTKSIVEKVASILEDAKVDFEDPPSNTTTEMEVSSQSSHFEFCSHRRERKIEFNYTFVTSTPLRRISGSGGVLVLCPIHS